MVKLKTVASALGSLGDVNRARAAFDDSSRKLADEQAFPPADVRPSPPMPAPSLCASPPRPCPVRRLGP